MPYEAFYDYLANAPDSLCCSKLRWFVCWLEYLWWNLEKKKSRNKWIFLSDGKK